jgi:hypothetical protein
MFVWNGHTPSLRGLPAAYQAEPAEIRACRSAILPAIVPETQSAAPALSFLKTSTLVRQLKAEPEVLAATLQRTFSQEELLDTGILEPSTGGATRLSPVFGGPQSSFVICKDAKGVPIDVVSARGALSGAQRELIRLAHEIHIGDDTLEQHVLLAFDDSDVHLFQQLGLRFTTAAPLTPINGDRVRPYFSARHPDRRARKSSFTIALWQLHSLKKSPTPQSLALLQSLRDLHGAYGLVPAELFKIWLPTDADFNAFHRAVRFRQGQLLAGEFAQSLRTSSFAPEDAAVVLRDRSTPTFSDALRDLQQVVADSNLFALGGEAEISLKKLDRAVDKILAPFTTAGDSADRWERLGGPLVAAAFRE